MSTLVNMDSHTRMHTRTHMRAHTQSHDRSACMSTLVSMDCSAKGSTAHTDRHGRAHTCQPCIREDASCCLNSQAPLKEGMHLHTHA